MITREKVEQKLIALQCMQLSNCTFTGSEVQVTEHNTFGHTGTCKTEQAGGKGPAEIFNIFVVD